MDRGQINRIDNFTLNWQMPMILLVLPFPPRVAKTSSFVILLCLMSDDFTHQGRASGWERVKGGHTGVCYLN